MIRFRDFIGLLVIITLIFVGAFQLKQLRWNPNTEIDMSIHRSDSRRLMAVELTETWSSFQLPAGSDSVRILTNAVVASDSATSHAPTLSDPRQGFRYAVEYQLLDEHSNLIQQNVYHFRSKLREKIDRETGEIIHPIKIADSEELVAQTRVMQFSLESKLKDVRVIRIKQSSASEEIKGLLARSVYRSYRKDHDSFGEWDRISEPRKELISKHAVYDHALLDDQTKEGLLKWKWLRATPLGNFDRRYIYFIGDNDDPAVSDLPYPQGSIVEPGWKIVVPTSNQRVAVRVEATPLEQDSIISGGISYTFIDPLTRQRVRGTLPFEDNSGSESKSVVIENVTGLVEFETACSAALRFWSRQSDSDDTDQWNQITVEPNQCITYVADDRPVAFEVSHFRDEATPLKATFRFVDQRLFSIEPSSSALSAANIKWRYVDAEGKTIMEGSEQFEPSVSVHERIWKERNTFSLSDPISLWFPVPAHAKKVEFWNEDIPFLVNAYVRPHGLSSHTRVPEDYDVTRKSESPFRRWFVIRPENYREYVSENRMLPLSVQSRLPDPPEEVDQKKRKWVQYQPKGDWIAARLLVPAVDPLNSGSTTVLPDSEWLWHELESRKPTLFSLVKRTSHYKKLLLAFASENPSTPIKLWCNNQLVVDRQFVSSRGEFEVQLPESEGEIRIAFEKGVRVFASGIKINSDAGYFRRSAMRIGEKPIRFDYEKKTSEDEHLTLTFYRDNSESKRAEISAKIIPLGSTLDSYSPRTMWTILNRRYDLSPMPISSSVLMDRRGSIDSGSRCFLTLGSDMPPGKYTIEVVREDSDNGYLLLHQTTHELETVRRVGIFDNPDGDFSQ